VNDGITGFSELVIGAIADFAQETITPIYCIDWKLKKPGLLISIYAFSPKTMAEQQ